MPKRALITGVTGQDGFHLAEFLLSKNYEVFGLVRGQNNPKADLLRAELAEVRIVPGDVTDMTSILRAIELARPDELYNLAAVSLVPYSWISPSLTADVTGKGALHVLEATRLSGARPRFYQASSSEMFGKAQTTPQSETTRFWPRSPYGAAKAFAHYMTVNHRESYGLHASSGILFNHEGPRRGVEFVTRKISRAVARISLGLQEKVTLGNLDALRDWGYAGDFVEAMWLMLQQDVPDDYVIATGESHSVREFLEVAFEQVGIQDWRSRVVQDASLFRPAEVDVLIGDSSKARARLGWKPRVQFEDLVRLMVEHDILTQKRLLE